MPVTCFDSGADFRDYFAAHCGPTITAYAAHADDPDRIAALDALGDREGTRSDGRFTMEWEYLLTTAEVA